MELWDAYDSLGNKLGFDLVRGEEIPNGVYHIVVEIITLNKDKILITKRDLNKNAWPGMHECNGGSALKGENPFVAAKRELFEETGISKGIFKRLYTEVSNDTIYVCYLCKTKQSNVILQEGETIDYLWLDKEKFFDYIENDFIPTQKDRFIKNKNLIMEVI